jgi:hypothetical protein
MLYKNRPSSVTLGPPLASILMLQPAHWIALNGPCCSEMVPPAMEGENLIVVDPPGTFARDRAWRRVI